MTPKGTPTSFALTATQGAIWFDQTMAPTTSRHHVSTAIRVMSDFDVDVARSALELVVDRNPSLRTTFHSSDGVPFQTVHPTMAVDLAVEDGQGWTPAQIDARLRDFHLQPFDLEVGPPVRFLAIDSGVDQSVVSFVMHHLVSDTWSLTLLGDAVSSTYRSMIDGEIPPPVEERESYEDFVASTEQVTTGADGEATRDFWRSTFEEWSPLPLVTDRPHDLDDAGLTQAFTVDLPSELAQDVTTLAARLGISVRSAVLAALHGALRAHTGADRIFVGELKANRSLSRARLIGCCINQVTRMAAFDDSTTLGDLARSVHAEGLAARRHERYPFTQLLRELRPGHGSEPFFGAMFHWQKTSRAVDVDLSTAIMTNRQDASSDVAGFSVEPMPMPAKTSPVPLTLLALSARDTLSISFEYQEHVFDRPTVERLAHAVITMLTTMVDDVDAPVDLVDVVAPDDPVSQSREETDALRQNATSTVPALVLRQTLESPAAVVLKMGATSITASGLDERSNQLARHLVDAEVAPGDLVALCLDRSIETVVAMLAIWKSGAGYVPIDPDLPARRIASMLDDASVKVVVTNEPAWQRVISSTEPADDATQRTIGATTPIEIDTDARQIAALPSDPLDFVADPSDVAYVYFTSGSTGRPKGVVVEHHSVASFLRSMVDRLEVSPSDVFLAATTFTFDPSVLELFGPLIAGATAELVTRDVILDPLLMSSALDRVTIAQGTPTMWKMLIDAGWRGNRSLTCLSGGEALTQGLADGLRERSRALWNLYGPTETTVWASAARVESGAGPISVGDPLDGVQFHIRNEQLVPVPTGRQGELLIGGTGVARGYVGRADLTAERFIDDPFDRTDSKLYRTGDLVRRRPDGRLEFRGRSDHQVKIRGHRIELGDIESALDQAPSVERSVVVVKTVADDDRLVGYFTVDARSNGVPQVDAIRDHLRQTLPAYMIPSHFVPVDDFDYTSSNKIDRGRLPDPTAAPSSVARDTGAPDSASDTTDVQIAGDVDPRIVEVVLDAYRDVFGDESISIDDDFFALGGHSLLATKIISRVRDRLSSEVPLRSLFEHPTPRRLAIFAAISPVHATTPSLDELTIELEPSDADGSEARPATHALSYSQERMWLLHQMHPESSAYNLATAIHLSGRLDVDLLAAAIRQVVQRHTSLRSRFVEVDGAPRIQIEQTVDVDVEVVDHRRIGSIEEQRRAATRAMEADANRPFDLTEVPLFRVGVHKIGDDEMIVLATMHHIISDQWSFGVFTQEIAALLERGGSPESPESSGEATHSLEPVSRLPRAELYNTWQRRRFEAGDHDGSLSYWRQQLSALPTVEMPTDRPRPPVASTRGRTVARPIPPALLARVKATATSHQATEFMVMFSAFNALVHRTTGADDIAIGIPIANRHWIESEHLITSLVNTLVMRTVVSTDASFSDLLRHVRTTSLDAFAHQDVPFGRLVQELAPTRDASRTPLFQLFFNMQNAPLADASIDGLDARVLQVARDAAQFDLSLTVDAGLNRTVSLEYATDLFDEARIDALLDDYLSLLDEFTTDPTVPVSGTERWPVGSTGASVRNAAERPAPASPTPVDPDAEPLAGTEQQVAAVWARVLGAESIRRHDNFFDLGGHSILAIRVFAELEALTGRRPPLTTLFQAPTIASFAALLDTEGWLSPWTSMIELQPGAPQRPLFYVAPYLVSALSLYELADELSDDLPMFIFQPQGLETDDRVHETIEEMAAHYIREMRSAQPHGPYLIGGHCAGGWVAFEMTRQLQAEGHVVDRLIVVDIEPPGITPPPRKWTRFVVSRALLYGRTGPRGIVDAIRWQIGRSRERSKAKRNAPSKHLRSAYVRHLHEQAHRRYTGGKIEGDLLLVRSEEWTVLADKDWHTDWGRLISGTLAIETVGGSHARLLDGHAAVELADIIRAAVETGGNHHD